MFETKKCDLLTFIKKKETKSELMTYKNIYRFISAVLFVYSNEDKSKNSHFSRKPKCLL